MSKFLFTFAAVAAFAASANAQVTITEVRIDQTSADNDEFFELTGTPGTSLDGLTYIVIGDGTGASGTIETALDLTGQVIPADGVFLCAEPSFTLGTPDFTTPGTDLNFENGDNVTHMLVSGFTGATNDDTDVDDDGVLDFTPWTAIVDMVAFKEADQATSGEHFYGDVIVGPEGPFVPGSIQRNDYGGLTVWTVVPFGDLSQNTPGTANGDGVFIAGNGGAQFHFLDAGAANAGSFYIFATTTGGTSPGIPAFGLSIPLNPSPILTYSTSNFNGPVFQHTLGFLDGNGKTWAALQIPPVSPALAGITAHTAAVVLAPTTLAGITVEGPVPFVVL
jgi:hypothetical protein